MRPRRRFWCWPPEKDRHRATSRAVAFVLTTPGRRVTVAIGSTGGVPSRSYTLAVVSGRVFSQATESYASSTFVASDSASWIVKLAHLKHGVFTIRSRGRVES